MEKSPISKYVTMVGLVVTLMASAAAHGWNLRELKACQDDITVLKAAIIKQDTRYTEQMILLTEIKAAVKSLDDGFKKHEQIK